MFSGDGDWKAVVGVALMETMDSCSSSETATIQSILRDGPKEFLSVSTERVAFVVEAVADDSR